MSQQEVYSTEKDESTTEGKKNPEKMVLGTLE